MNIQEKVELNKVIRKYDGSNEFILSLKRSLSSKYCKREALGERIIKILSDKQYDSAKETLYIL